MDDFNRHPLIIDFQDNFSVYKSQASQRKNFYKQHFETAGYEDLYVNLDESQDMRD